MVITVCANLPAAEPPSFGIPLLLISVVLSVLPPNASPMCTYVFRRLIIGVWGLKMKCSNRCPCAGFRVEREEIREKKVGRIKVYDVLECIRRPQGRELCAGGQGRVGRKGGAAQIRLARDLDSPSHGIHTLSPLGLAFLTFLALVVPLFRNSRNLEMYIYLNPPQIK